MKDPVKILVYGYGNPGRRDDGLGPALIEKIDEWIRENGISHIDTDSNYQLNIEDAYNIRDYDLVIFADASYENIRHLLFDRVTRSSKVAFNTHSVSPGFVLELCEKLYKKSPAVFLLHMKGHEFDLREGLSDQGKEVLDVAFGFLADLLAKPQTILAQTVIIER